MNADPLGSIPKPNKKTRQEKANLLPIVQAAIGRFLAVAAVSAPSLLPIPVAPVLYEEENIVNLQIQGQPKFFMPISDPVISYVTNTSADAEGTDAYA